MSASWFQFEDGGSYVGEVDSAGGTAQGFGVARGRDGRAEYAGSWNSGFEQSGTFRSSSGSDSYEGQWSEGKKNGLGVERSGRWIYRGEWTDGLKGRYGIRQGTLSTAKYEGTWASGLQDGYGMETNADGGTYQGQWSRGLRHGYGIRQSATYEMTIVTRDSFKSRADASRSPFADSVAPGTAGSRSAAAAAATVSRNTTGLEFGLRRHDRKTESGGGFVLTEDVAFDGSHRRFGLLLDRLGLRRTGRRRSFSGSPPPGDGVATPEGLRLQQTQYIQVRPSHEALNVMTGTRAVVKDDDDLSLCGQKDVLEGGLIERYLGEWNRDARVGYGVCHRSDGLLYEGEWLNDKKNGYGRTTLQDGTKLEGKYKNNTLVSSHGKTGKGPKLFTDTLLEKVENAVKGAQMAAENAKQKADIALIRVPSAQVKADEADIAAREATRNEEIARFQASKTNQLTAKPGNQLAMHRMNEKEFLVSYDSGEVVPAAGASKGPSSLRLRLPFNLRSKQHHHQQHPDHFAARKPDQQKRFPWQKTKTTGMTHDERRWTEVQEASTQLTGGRHGDTFHLQQPVLLGSGGREDFGPSAHHSLSGATGGGVHFDSRGGVSQLHSMTPTRPSWQGINGGVGGGGRGVGKERRDLLRKELIEAVEPADARHPRRNSLPCIVKQKIFDGPAQSTPAHSSPPASPTKHLPTPNTDEFGKRRSLLEPPGPITPPRRPSHTETYLIDRGVRKRVRNLYEDVEKVQRSPSAKQQRSPSFRSPTMGAMGKLFMSTMVTGFALSQSTPLRDWSQDSTSFRKMYSLESPTSNRKTKTGSNSDVSKIKPSEVLSREVVYVMSQRKREELIRKRAEEEARRMRGEIVISLAMFQDWRVLLTLLFLLVIAGLVFKLKDSNFS